MIDVKEMVARLFTDEQRYLFDLQGFLVIREALDPATLAELNSAVDAQDLPAPGDDFAGQVFSEFLTWGPAFRNLLDHPAVHPLLLDLFEKRLRLDRYYGIRMRTGTSGLPLHGGACEAHDQSEYYMFRNGRMSSGIVTVSWALTDMVAGQGGFVCVPGSHKSNFPVPVDWDHHHDAAHHVELRAGDLVMFNGAIVHGTHPWSAEHERRTLLFKYAPAHLAWSQVYLNWSEELRSSLSDSQRMLLEPPYCLPHHHDPTDKFTG